MPLWLGHGKRLEAVEHGLVELNKNMDENFDDVKKSFLTVIEEIKGLKEQNSSGLVQTGQETAEPPITLPDEESDPRFKAINDAMSRTTDPVKLQEYTQAKKIIRADMRNERLSRKRRLGWYDRKRGEEPYEPEIVETGAPPSPEEVEEIAQRVGVTKAGGLDPIKFATGIKGLVDKNPGLAKTLFKAFGGDKLLADAGITGGLEAGLGLLDEIIKQGKADELAATVGNGLGALVKEKVGPWVMSKATPTPTQTPLVPAGPQQQFTNPQGLTCTFGPDGKAYAYDPATKGFTTRLWMRDGIGWIDPRLRYPMPTGPGLV